VFAHAPVCLHPRERRYSDGPHPNDWATPAWTGAILERMQIREIAEGDELIPGVGVVDLPGHSPGSIGLTVQNAHGLSLVSGDAVHSARVALSRQTPLVFWSAAEARASIDRAVAMADVIYPGHDQAFRLTAAGEVEYLRPFRLTITGTLADRPGLAFSAAMPDPWVMPGIEEQARRV
jgi:N-acyl homoserine lactone hydrolase